MANSAYGGVPHGIWIGNARQVLIANLTIRDVYFHPIQLDPSAGAQAPRIYNVRLVDAGEQFRHRGVLGHGVHHHGQLRLHERRRRPPGRPLDRPAQPLSQHRAPAELLAGPAIFMWNRSRDTLVEGNLFLNVQYGIALGLDPGRSDDHAGGIVRNNIFHRGPAQSGDVGIVINNSARTRVLHNTVVLSDTYPNAIEYRFPATTGIEIRYNLSDGAVQRRDGASGTVAGNVTNTQLGWFVDAAGGDLHLAASATPAIAAASRGEQRLRPGDPSHRSAARRRRRRAGRESRPSGKPERPAGAVTRGLPIQGI